MIDNTNKALSCSGEGRVIYPQLDGWAEQSGERKSYGSCGAHIKPHVTASATPGAPVQSCHVLRLES